jgi:DNA polymerase-3 subunit delta'
MYPVSFNEILGNDHIKRQLQCMIAKQAVGHALLFAGPDGIGKGLFAWALAAEVMTAFDQTERHLSKIQLGLHPDVHLYRPEGKLGLHSIAALRQLSEEVYLPPYESSWKVFVIQEAERMLSYSANALLKTFEEPPPRTMIILTSHSKAALLPTILSRCRTLHFHPVDDAAINGYLKLHYQLDDGICATIARQAQGSIGRAKRLAEEKGESYRVELLKLLSAAPIGCYRTLQTIVQKIGEQVESVKKQAEESAKEELYKIPVDQVSAAQQQILEKELEGLVSLAFMQEAQDVFESVLSWYRDMELLLAGGDTSGLINGDHSHVLEQAVQRGACKPLKQVQVAVEEALLTLRRSTGFTHCFETLLLKLNVV